MANIFFISSFIISAIFFIIFIILLTFRFAKNQSNKKFDIFTGVSLVLALLALIAPFTFTTNYVGEKVWRTQEIRSNKITKDIKIVEKAYKSPTVSTIRSAKNASIDLKKQSKKIGTSKATKSANRVYKDFKDAKKVDDGYDDYISWQVDLEYDSLITVPKNLITIISENSRQIAGTNKTTKTSKKLTTKMSEDTKISNFIDWWFSDAE